MAVWFTQVPVLFQLGMIVSIPTSSFIWELKVTGAPIECDVADMAPMVGLVKSLGPLHVSESTTLSE